MTVQEDIIQKISSIISYKIELNNLTISDKNIYIDLSQDYAPFNLENSYIEAEETLYWLDLSYSVNLIEYNLYESLRCDCEELIKLGTSIILAVKRKIEQAHNS